MTNPFIPLTETQANILNNMKPEVWYTADQLQCHLRTLIVLGGIGLVERDRQLGTKEVFGMERTKIKWKLTELSTRYYDL